MTGIEIVCVGKIKEPFIARGVEAAAARIRKRYPVIIRECPDEATPDGVSPAEEEKILKTEGQRILSCIRREDYVVALCIEGKHYDSPSWHRHLDSLARQVRGYLVFVIGGSLGLSPEVVRRADEELSFSAMTFPHQLMRLILLDQIADWVDG